MIDVTPTQATAHHRPAGNFDYFLEKAEAGNPLAQRQLSHLYQGADGFSEDPSKAFNWMLEAAKNGDISAQISIASQYLQGWYIDQNPSEAKRWYLEAAKSGEVHAQYRLAAGCAGSDFGYEDIDATFFWLRKAAYQNRSDLQYFLGGFEGSVLGGEPNFEQSYYWLEVARLNGHVSDDNWIDLARAELNVSEAEAARNKASKFVDGCKEFELHLYNFTPEDWQPSSHENLSTNYAVLSYQYEWDANNGVEDPELHFRLGSLFYLSENRRNLKQVYYWLSKAADAGHQKASYALKALQASEMQFD